MCQLPEMCLGRDLGIQVMIQVATDYSEGKVTKDDLYTRRDELRDQHLGVEGKAAKKAAAAKAKPIPKARAPAAPHQSLSTFASGFSFSEEDLRGLMD